MKRLFLILGLILICGKAWAIPDQIQPQEFTGSQVVKATPSAVYSVTVSYAGVTAGDKVQLKDAASDTGSVRYTCVASGANGSCTNNYIAGALFSTAIYLKETKSGGNFYTDIQLF